MTAVNTSAIGQQTFSLPAGTRIPAVGEVVTVDATDAHYGVVGRVVSVTPGSATTVITTTPVPLSEAYSDFVVSSVGVGLDLGAKSRTRAMGLSCSGTTTAAPQFDVAMTKSFYEFTFDARQRTLHFLIGGTLQTAITFVGAPAGYSCSFNLDGLPIPIAGPITMRVGLHPSVSISPSFDLPITTNTSRFTAGYDAAPTLKGSPALGGSTTTALSQPSANGTLTLRLAVAVAVLVGGLAGVEGSVGPELAGKISFRAKDLCFAVDGGVGADLSLIAEAWITNWKFTFLKGSFQLPLLQKCWSRVQPPPPSIAPGVATWTQDTTLPDGTVIDHGDGRLSVSTSTLRNGQVVDLNFQLQEYDPRYSNAADIPCRDPGPVLAPTTALRIVVSGTVSVGGAPTEPRGYFVTAGPWTRALCRVGSRFITTTSYAGKATFILTASDVLTSAPIGVYWSQIVNIDGVPATTTYRATGASFSTTR